MRLEGRGDRSRVRSRLWEIYIVGDELGAWEPSEEEASGSDGEAEGISAEAHEAARAAQVAASQARYLELSLIHI